jgi:hypothetical protein
MIGSDGRRWTLADRPSWGKGIRVPLNQSLLHSGVRIIGSVPDPTMRTGERRVAIGTGFLITVPSTNPAGQRYGYVLTAHHVIWDQNRVEIQAPDPTTNGELHPPLAINDWRQPLDNVDLALAPVRDASGRIYQAIELEKNVVPPRTVPALGASIYYVGILMPLDRPMARSGTIGAVEQYGIKHSGGYDYPVHLVDCRSYGGFSGSPCFLDFTFASLTAMDESPFTENVVRGAVGEMAHIALLCGMFTQHLEDREQPVASRYGVGTMLRSQEIWRALMSDEMKREREDWDRELAAAEKAHEDTDQPKLRGASSVAVDDEFERFEELTRKLVNTPKSEIDEKRKADQ